MTLINLLNNHDTWNEFLNYKLENKFIKEKEKNYLIDFINNKKYQPIASLIATNNYTFTNPKKKMINKISKGKKRIVYTYTEEENMILKLLAYLLYEYNYLLSKRCYSFCKNTGVKKAINDITNFNLKNYYGYKLDISNYFNSISPAIILKMLKDDIDNDLYNLFHQLLSNDKVIYNNEIISEEKGIMAGTPISAFLANYYLKELDKYFEKEKIVYARYADDIIIFTKTKEEIETYKLYIENVLNEYNLTINHSKEQLFLPKDKWEFLGFSYQNNVIDLSDNSVKKIKGKIKRTSRGIRRWKIKKNASDINALKAMIRRYNSKFFGSEINDELTWKYWFFPVINTTKSLKEVDNYLQEELRYMITGKHNKKNFEKVPYQLLKECGYRSLVHEYYLFKE